MDNVIIFNDGSRKWVEKKVADSIIKASTANLKHIMIGDQMIRFSSIAKLLTNDEFDEQYPNEVKGANPDVPLFKSPKEEYFSIEKQAEKRQSAYKSMLGGMKKFIDREQAKGVTPHNAIALYEEKLARYKKIFKACRE